MMPLIRTSISPDSCSSLFSPLATIADLTQQTTYNKELGQPSGPPVFRPKPMRPEVFRGSEIFFLQPTLHRRVKRPKQRLVTWSCGINPQMNSFQFSIRYKWVRLRRKREFPETAGEAIKPSPS